MDRHPLAPMFLEQLREHSLIGFLFGYDWREVLFNPVFALRRAGEFAVLFQAEQHRRRLAVFFQKYRALLERFGILQRGVQGLRLVNGYRGHGVPPASALYITR